MGADFAAPAGEEGPGTAASSSASWRYRRPALLFRTACPWRLPPRDFPKRSTVQRYIYARQAEGLWERVNFLLVQQARERDGAKPAHPADIQDRDGAGFDPLTLPMAAPSLRPSRGRAFADGAYARATSRRQRLPGAAVDAGQAVRPGPRFLSIAQAMGRRADLRLVWTQSPADEGL